MGECKRLGLISYETYKSSENEKYIEVTLLILLKIDLYCLSQYI